MCASNNAFLFHFLCAVVSNFTRENTLLNSTICPRADVHRGTVPQGCAEVVDLPLVLLLPLQLQLQKTQYLQLGQNRGQYYGGSLPNVNQIGNTTVDLPFQVISQW